MRAASQPWNDRSQSNPLVGLVGLALSMGDRIPVQAKASIKTVDAPSAQRCSSEAAYAASASTSLPTGRRSVPRVIALKPSPPAARNSPATTE
jgi:hypothetical protein